MTDAHIIERLFTRIAERRAADPAASYVASLCQKGLPKIAGKLGEETAELIVEAVKGDRGKLAEESADLLFHLLVLLAETGVRPQDVYAVLEKRFGTGGLEEKAARKEHGP